MSIEFVKMQGLGNDFVVIDATKQASRLTKPEILRMADRRFGVGFDQMLVVEACDDAEVDFWFRIFNADGAEVEQCGNGARCVAAFIKQQGLSNKAVLRLMTLGGVLTMTHKANGDVMADMGVPRFSPEAIPFLAAEERLTYLLMVEDKKFELSVVNLGNPHAVIVVNSLQADEVAYWGKKIESHPQFPQGVNAGFMQIIDRQRIRLQVYERGAGQTLACGSGACAAMIAGCRRDMLDSAVQVEQLGGSLWIEWSGEGQSVYMTGPAETVFTGCWPGE